MREEIQRALERGDADDEIVAALVERLRVSAAEAQQILQREKAQLDLADVDTLDDTFDEPF